MAPENNFNNNESVGGKLLEMKKYSKEVIDKVIGMATPLLKKEEGREEIQKYGKLGRVFQMMTYPASFRRNLKDFDVENRA